MIERQELRHLQRFEVEIGEIVSAINRFLCVPTVGHMHEALERMQEYQDTYVRDVALRKEIPYEHCA